jgi:hypothetical protein
MTVVTISKKIKSRVVRRNNLEIRTSFDTGSGLADIGGSFVRESDYAPITV